MNPWDWLDKQHVMTIATTGSAGPWAAAVYFARDERRFLFVSSSRSRHALDLARDARCAATVNGDAPDWTSIRGVQIAGRARVLVGDAADAARAIYFRRFADMLDNADPEIRDALARIGYFELVPERMLFIDNSNGLGYRESIL